MNKRIQVFAACMVLIGQIATAQQFSYKKSAEGIEISENGKPVLFYQVKPKTVEGKYERSGYIHPLFDMKGNVLTEDMPEDHPYHRGVFWAWHQIMIDGKKVADGWTSDNIWFEPGKMQVTKSSKNVILSSQVMWRINDSIKAPVNIINEITRINIRAAKENYRVIDFDIKLKPTVGNVMLGGSEDAKGYGGFCVRMKLPDDIRFISNGKDIEPQDTAVQAGPWMDFKTADGGVIIMGYRNEGEPHPWILRKSKSMQNVPFPGRDPVAVPEEGLNLKYRLVIHKGDLSNADIEKIFNDFQMM